MVLSIFFPSVTGMNAQSEAMGTVSDNIANMRTTGYKSADTMFQTLLGSQPATRNNASGLASSRADITGVSSYTRYNILDMGVISSTGNPYDVALNEQNAFFMIDDGYDGLYYSRAGDFSTRVENGMTYLVNSSGYYVQGFQANGDGTFASEPSDISLQFGEKMPSVPTSEVEITANVPADGVDSSTYGVTIYGPNNDGKTMNMVFTKAEGLLNTWNVNFVLDGGEVAGGPIEVQFSPNGELLSPKTFNITANWDDGSSNNITMNIENMTQYAGSAGEVYVSQDGDKSGELVSSYIDGDGILKAKYSNDKTVDVAKLAVVSFQSPENLVPVTGTMFEAYSDAGEINYLLDAEKNTTQLVVPQSLEASNVDVEQEFVEMIQVQRAYSLNSSAFTVANEMTSVAVDLKT